MLNMEEINAEIKKLEEKDCTTYDLCNKLAILYTVRNNYRPPATTTKTNSMDLDMSKSLNK